MHVNDLIYNNISFFLREIREVNWAHEAAGQYLKKKIMMLFIFYFNQIRIRNSFGLFDQPSSVCKTQIHIRKIQNWTMCSSINYYSRISYLQFNLTLLRSTSFGCYTQQQSEIYHNYLKWNKNVIYLIVLFNNYNKINIFNTL